MAKRYMATYHTGYCGTEHRHYIIADSENQVEEYMEDGLLEYAENWTHVAFGWGNSYTDEDFEDYCQNCYYEIKELSDEDFEDVCEEYGVDESDFEDIT